MFIKLLKKDLKRNMRWMWILFVSTLVFAGISRGVGELGKGIAFFRVVGIIFDSIFYALLVNCIIQPFVRNFFNFTKTIYGDESYLTHTLPVTKNQIINSKYLTAIIELMLGFVCLIISIIIKFASANALDFIKFILSQLITGEFSVLGVLTLFAVLVIMEFLMYISIIYFSIIVGYKSNEKKVLKSFLFVAAFAYAVSNIVSVIMLITMLLCGINITSSELIFSASNATILFIIGIMCYAASTFIFYLLSKKELNKGVNVD